jgi:hypothetical protein
MNGVRDGILKPILNGESFGKTIVVAFGVM